MRHYKDEAAEFAKNLKANDVQYYLIEKDDRSSIAFNWTDTVVMFTDYEKVEEDKVLVVYPSKDDPDKYDYCQCEINEVLATVISSYFDMVSEHFKEMFKEEEGE